jgi:hypothetical protein
MFCLRLKPSTKEYRFKPTCLIALIYNYGEAPERGGGREGGREESGRGLDYT